MQSKTIITHNSPDLDSCTAIWILKNFVYPLYNFDYIFVDVGDRVANISNSIHVDTGGIDYDHHDTNELISATSLVYSKNRLENKSLKKLVDLVVKLDHGLPISFTPSFLDLHNAIIGLYGKDSLRTLNAVMVILDGVYNNLLFDESAKENYKKGLVFNSKYGKGIAFDYENHRLRKMAYEDGFVVFIFKDVNTGFAGFKAPGNSTVDFSDLFLKIKEVEPKSDWFLHASKQLLLCGSSKAPNKRLTNLSLNQLIKIIEDYA